MGRVRRWWRRLDNWVWGEPGESVKPRHRVFATVAVVVGIAFAVLVKGGGPGLF